LNPALTANVLNLSNGHKNNGLRESVANVKSETGELFESEFSSTMKDILSVDGKLQPLDLATLKDLGIEEFTELENLSSVQLLLETAESKSQPMLNNLTNEKIESIDLFGNPDANTLLKTNLINEDLLEEGMLNKGILKSETPLTKSIVDASQQPILKRNADLANILDDISFPKNIEVSVKNSFDTNELLAHTGKQEINATKLVDHLASIDKSINAINPLSNSSLKSSFNVKPSAMMMNRIEVPVSQAGWGEAMGSRLMMMVNGKVQSANIHLNPAELGPIEIRINVNQEQASVYFVSNNAVVREAIEDAFPRLKEMFAQNGLSLADTNVSQQSSRQNNQYASEQNVSLNLSNDETLEIDDDQTEDANEKMIDIGIVDQYV